MLKVIILAAFVVAVASDSALYEQHPAFTLNLIKTLTGNFPKSNLMCSPHSTFHALLVAYFGAHGLTKSSLKRGLFLDNANNVDDKMVRSWYAEEMQILADMEYSATIQFTSVDKLYISEAANVK